MMFTPIPLPIGDSFAMPLTTPLSLGTAATMTCQFSLRTDGHEWATTTNNTVVDQGAFITPVGHSVNYDVRSTLTSGTLTTDPSAGTWIALTSNRTWTLATSSIQDILATITVDFRVTGSTSIVFSKSVTLEADKTA
jgi:hypothetical protein